MSDSRLFKILYYLLDRKQATAPELAAEFEVSTRTIYRDMEALSSAGIPVYAEPGRNGGIYLLQDFILDRAILSENEKQDFRIFKLNRILEWELLENTFVPRPYPETKNNLQQTYTQIVLLFSKEIAYRVYDEFDRTEMEYKENGDLIVCAKMPVDSWLIGYLLSFGAQVEIIEPKYLKDVLAEQAQAIYKKNKS